MDDTSKRDDRLSTLYEIAYMYYGLDMSQQEIAKRTFLSRPHISRLLKQARSEGVVEIKLNYFGERSHYAEKSLKAEFGLSEALVYNCKSISAEERHNTICRYGARCIESALHVGAVVGITRGNILAGVIQAFRRSRRLDLRVVQLMGAEAFDSRSSAPDLIRRMVDIFGGTTVYLDAPLYVENDMARNNLIREPFLRKKLQDAKSAEIVVTSIRPMYKGMKEHVWAGFIDGAQIDEVIDAGGVGYLLGRAFDIEGRLIEHPLNRRVIGLHPDELRSKKVIGIAYDQRHAQAVLGALRGGYIKTFITDFECANAVLSLLD